MSIRKLAVAVALSVFVVSGAVFAQAHKAPAPAPAPAAVHEAAPAAADEAAEEEAAVAAAQAAAAEAAAAKAAAEAEAAEAAAEAAAAQAAADAEAAKAAAAQVAAVAPAAKPETKVDFYGTASYRFRGRLWSVSTEAEKSGSSFDYLNLLGWSFGSKIKVDDKLSLQFQIGNDLNSGESVTWANNKAPQGRAATDNLYVHLAYATWNPGPFSLTGGVIPVTSNGTLDLFERSISTGSYGEAIFQTWSTQLINSLIAIKLGVPIIKDGIKISAELTSSVIDPRTQDLKIGIGSTGAKGVDDAGKLDTLPKGNPTSALLILDIPIVAGDLKITPQVTSVLNRNYNSALENGDNEILAGLSAGYKVSDAISLNLNGAFGTISNENSLVGAYGNIARSGTDTTTATKSTATDVKTKKSGDTTTTTTITTTKTTTTGNGYISNGFIAGLGATIKAGPGALAIGVSYGNSYNGAKEYTETTKIDSVIKVTTSTKNPLDEDGDPIVTVIPPTTKGSSTTNKSYDPKNLTNKNDILFDVRYTWNLHPKFNIAPRWRLYVSTYDEGSGHVKLKMENRPEIVLTGTF
jgi:hypothetical protein